MEYAKATKTAQDYYDSKSANEFYFAIWGGEDIHVGIYNHETEPIAEASRRTVERMAQRLPHLGPNSRVLDAGAGYGGAARYLVQKTGCHVTCLNLSEVQNERNREANKKAHLDEHIEVLGGSFEEIPAPDAHFDAVWSEDAILHAGDRVQVLREINRVLKPGGDLVFTDPMQADDCPEGVLQPVYDRIQLSSLASFAFYREAAGQLGMEEVDIDNLSHCLPQHYGRVREELQSNYDRVVALADKNYVDRMIQGLGHWIDAGNQGHLAWGILHFRKPE